MKKRLLTFFLITIISQNLFSQENISSSMVKREPQAAFAELYGRSLDYSINYDRRFSRRRNSLGLTVGISYYPAPDLFSIPINVNYLLGKNDNYMEIGGGVTYFRSSLTNSTFEDKFYENYLGYGKVNKIIGVLTMGYRYQPLKGFIFRIGLNGWLNNKPEKRFINPLPYLALGYSF